MISWSSDTASFGESNASTVNGLPFLSSSVDGYDRVLAFRPTIPPTPEEASEVLLEKLEQAGKVPSKDKFRRMACNTFVFTGCCPYSDRCVFLHDYRIKAEGVKVRTTRQSRTTCTVKDTFYWPDMTRKEVIRTTDTQGLPSANQMYLIPEAFKSNINNFHNRGLYSLWSHFVEYCLHNSVFYGKKYRDVTSEPFFQMSNYKENPHVPGAHRLPIFIQLSLGKIFAPAHVEIGGENLRKSHRNQTTRQTWPNNQQKFHNNIPLTLEKNPGEDQSLSTNPNTRVRFEGCKPFSASSPVDDPRSSNVRIGTFSYDDQSESMERWTGANSDSTEKYYHKNLMFTPNRWLGRNVDEVEGIPNQISSKAFDEVNKPTNAKHLNDSNVSLLVPSADQTISSNFGYNVRSPLEDDDNTILTQLQHMNENAPKSHRKEQAPTYPQYNAQSDMHYHTNTPYYAMEGYQQPQPYQTEAAPMPSSQLNIYATNYEHEHHYGNEYMPQQPIESNYNYQYNHQHNSTYGNNYRAYYPQQATAPKAPSGYHHYNNQTYPNQFMEQQHTSLPSQYQSWA